MDADVAIAGGGPAGCSAAIKLARAGLKVVLVERERPQFRPGESLPPSANLLLRELGILEAVLSDGHRPCAGTLSSWGSSELHCEDFVRQLNGRGLQLDRQRFDGRLQFEAERAGALLTRNAVLGVEQAPTDLAEPWLLSVAGGSHMVSLQSKILIDAGGRRASICRVLGGKRMRFCSLVGFWLRLRSLRRNDQLASTLVEATPAGWWYSVLLPNQERLVVFLTDSDLVDAGLTEVKRFWSRLQTTRHLSKVCRRHRYVPVGKPRGVDASGGLLVPPDVPGFLTIGDAAATFDPLSSKGISFAMYSGIQAAASCVSWLGGDHDKLARHWEHVRQVAEHDRLLLGQVYSFETRFSRWEFWSRRQPRVRVPSPPRIELV